MDETSTLFIAGGDTALGQTLRTTLRAAAITQDSSAVASGTPGWARLLSSGGTSVLDVDVSAQGGTGALQLTPNTVVAGAPVTASSFLIFE